MLLAEKLQRFLACDLKHDAEIDVKEAGNIGIRYPNRLGGVLFEEYSSLSSSYIRDRNSQAFLGAFSYMNSGGYMRGTIFIGRYCSIGRRVTIGAGTHNMSFVSTSPAFPGKASSRPYTAEESSKIKSHKKRLPIIIENDVWIGDGAVIMPGVRLRTGSVIGANAVVTRDVEPYSIYGGVPAKKIGERFSTDVASVLLSTEYWEHSKEDLRDAPKSNIFEFIEFAKRLPVPERHYPTFVTNPVRPAK